MTFTRTAVSFLAAVAFFAAAGFDGSRLSPPVRAQAKATKALTPEQDKAVRDIVRDYLLKHPEVIAEALALLREKQRIEQEKKVRAALMARRDELLIDKHTPVGGNPKGDITVVEFFDYQCGYCKRVMPTVREALKEDGNIRIVFKEFPILGEMSIVAAHAALAARKQGKYEEFHFALMGYKGRLSGGVILSLAKSVGLDTKKLRDDMNSPEVRDAIRKNLELATALNIQGTPAFVIGNKLVPGAVDRATFDRLIKEARDACKANGTKMC